MTHKTALVLIAHGTEEMEVVITVDVLRRAGIHVVLASVDVEGAVAECSRGVKVVGDVRLEDYQQQQQNPLDAIIIPGGLNGAKTMAASSTVRGLLTTYHKAGRLVAAICAGPTVLAAAGIAPGSKITSYPSVRAELDSDYAYSEERVVQDGNMITSRGPGTAMEFALAIAKYLVGQSQSETVAAQLILP
ncbi:class I glutamine amidotransferase-like protein [Thamnocephalis sphaerospora]|uniref:D-lactate dehydratase n=1 Tax=Thamnocephalis sphaerospora TaxID=78915 RepID=A0A4P9XRF2_9FUNG|nr:class I glutamine amidotransferase-like protein [Thamnocephalis sphaerospora]|eukprot:RKP08655.1 class I glutamine amidotransferase-like protein [Thamnocephalis sphaerospora]